jgi:[acyl-carrier-protein] S-malonyltransferase
MQEAVPVGAGAMAAVLGMSLTELEKVCAAAAQGEVCSPANINSPDQIVISGSTHAVQRATELARKHGAKRAIMLPVSAPFHCSLLQPAQDKMAQDLARLQLNEMRISVACNVDAKLVRTPDAARETLTRQVTGAVRWEQCVHLLIAQGVETFIEVGPGKVLCGLTRQIHRSKTCLNVEDEASLHKTIHQLASARSGVA